jgi:regulator of protease activity HflC (stomatin/prohibitin superfamily)
MVPRPRFSLRQFCTYFWRSGVSPVCVTLQNAHQQHQVQLQLQLQLQLQQQKLQQQQRLQQQHAQTSLQQTAQAAAQAARQAQALPASGKSQALPWILQACSHSIQQVVMSSHK